MAAGTWQFTNGFRLAMINGNLTSSLKLALFTTGTNLAGTSTTFAGVTNEVGVSNTGYTAGGIAITPVFAGTILLTCKANNPQWVAGTAGLSATMAGIYVVSGNVLMYVLLDSGGALVTAPAGEQLTVDLTTNPIFQV